MVRDQTTIEEYIRAVADITKAPKGFVDEVRELFLKKGIPLGQVVHDFEDAIERAFELEQLGRTDPEELKRQLRNTEEEKSLASKTNQPKQTGYNFVKIKRLADYDDTKPMVPGPKEKQ